MLRFQLLPQVEKDVLRLRNLVSIWHQGVGQEEAVVEGLLLVYFNAAFVEDLDLEGAMTGVTAVD